MQKSSGINLTLERLERANAMLKLLALMSAYRIDDCGCMFCRYIMHSCASDWPIHSQLDSVGRTSVCEPLLNSNSLSMCNRHRQTETQHANSHVAPARRCHASESPFHWRCFANSGCACIFDVTGATAFSIWVISNHNSFRCLIKLHANILYEKIFILQHWKWPAQGTSTVSVVSAHFRSLLMNFTDSEMAPRTNISRRRCKV